MVPLLVMYQPADGVWFVYFCISLYLYFPCFVALQTSGHGTFPPRGWRQLLHRTSPLSSDIPCRTGSRWLGTRPQQPSSDLRGCVRTPRCAAHLAAGSRQGAPLWRLPSSQLCLPQSLAAVAAAWKGKEVHFPGSMLMCVTYIVIACKLSTNLWNRVCQLGGQDYCPVALFQLQFIWGSGKCRFHLRVPDLQMSCSDLITWQGTRITVPAMATRWRAALLGFKINMYMYNFHRYYDEACCGFFKCTLWDFMMCHVLYWARLFVNSSPIHWIGFTPEPQYFFFRQLSNYCSLPSNLEYKWHQIPKIKCFSSCLAVVHPLQPGVKSRMKM